MSDGLHYRAEIERGQMLAVLSLGGNDIATEGYRLGDGRGRRAAAEQFAANPAIRDGNGHIDADAIAAELERLELAAIQKRDQGDTLQADFRAADSVEAQPVHWLWWHRLARGKMNLVAGEPGTGKSVATLDIAARVSTGAGWPDDPTPHLPHDVIILANEDDVGDTVRPRLETAGADLGRVHILDELTTQYLDGAPGAFQIPAHLPILRDKVRQTGAVLLVLDPLDVYLDVRDSHANAAVRVALGPLQRFAAETGVAVLAVKHLRKSATTNALHRISGSIAYAAAARMVHFVVSDPTDEDRRRRLWLPGKQNLCPKPDGLAFTLQSVGDYPRVEWGGPVTASADDILGESAGKHTNEQTEAADFLRAHLGDGMPQERRAVVKAAKADGLECSERTILRALKSLGGETKTIGGGSTWRLPCESKGGDTAP